MPTPSARRRFRTSSAPSESPRKTLSVTSSSSRLACMRCRESDSLTVFGSAGKMSWRAEMLTATVMFSGQEAAARQASSITQSPQFMNRAALSARGMEGRAGRGVDGARDVLRPGGGGAAGFLDHPVAQVHDQVGFLGERDEVV